MNNQIILLFICLDDYWTANKNIKESKEIILVVEVLCSNQNISNQAGYSVQYSEPINNASKYLQPKLLLHLQ